MVLATRATAHDAAPAEREAAVRGTPSASRARGSRPSLSGTVSSIPRIRHERNSRAASTRHAMLSEVSPLTPSITFEVSGLGTSTTTSILSMSGPPMRD